MNAHPTERDSWDTGDDPEKRFSKGRNEKSKDKYLFWATNDDNEPINHYGGHDWIADSALRLIALSEKAQDTAKHPAYNVSWLVTYNGHDRTMGNHRENFPYYVLDDTHGYRGLDDFHEKAGDEAWWWDDGDYRRCSIFRYQDWMGEGRLNADRNPDYSDEEMREHWLKVRRYVTFLHGTRLPDRAGDYIHEILSPSFEKARIENPECITSHPGHTHHFYWELKDGNSEKTLAGSDTEAATMAQRAARLAIHYLKKTYEVKYKEEVSQEAQEKQIKGKYEMGSLLLGVMTHYIGDLASPPHVLKEGKIYGNIPDAQQNWDTHDWWDAYADQFTRFKTGDEAGKSSDGKEYFPFGGPCWHEEEIEDGEGGSFITGVDPTYIDVKEGEFNTIAELEPKAPFLAAEEMAWLTFSADDQTNNPSDVTERDLAAIQLHWDFNNATGKNPKNYNKKEMKRCHALLKWAAYYTACAILWVVKESGISKRKDDTIGVRAYPYCVQENEEMALDPVGIEKINARETTGADGQPTIEKWASKEFANTTMMIALMALPALAAMAMKVISGYSQKEEEIEIEI